MLRVTGLSSQQVLFSRSFGVWFTDCSCHGAHITKPCIMNVSVFQLEAQERYKDKLGPP